MNLTKKSMGKVIDSKGKTIGKISLKKIIVAIARPDYADKSPNYK